MMEIRRANELGSEIRGKISGIFVGGFYQWLKYFSKDTEKLSRAFAHMFLLENFHVAVIDGEPAGIAACSDGKTPSVRINAAEFRRHLGLFMGTIAGIMLKKELECHPYPFPIEKGVGSVEFVATHKDYRGKGVAPAIIQHIFSVTPYSSYVLEVADTNAPAVSLYQKLGFAEIMRVPHKHSKQSGVNFLVYMKCEKHKL